VKIVQVLNISNYDYCKVFFLSNDSKMEETLKKLSEEPEIMDLMVRCNRLLNEFCMVTFDLVRLIRHRIRAVTPNITIDTRTLLISVITFLFGATIKKSPKEMLVAMRTMFQRLAYIVESVETDPPSLPLSVGEVLHKRSKLTAAFVGQESLTVHSDIKATGAMHASSSVRLFKKSALGEFEFVGMGIRVSEEDMWTPAHVFKQLTDAEFKMKGFSRNVATLTFDPQMIIKESPSNEDDYVVYRVGKSMFARTSTSKAKTRNLVMEKRVYVHACKEGTEYGTVSEGIPEQTPFNFMFRGSYSTVPGHSGAEVHQLDSGTKYLVGMHLAGVNDKGGVSNLFVSAAVLQDFTRDNESWTETNSSNSSGSSNDYRERVIAAQKAEDFQKAARARGDHRYDEGEMEAHWEEVNAEAAMRSYRANEKEFLETHSYAKGKGWRRAGGKTRGGKMTKYNESASELLKGFQREVAPQRQISNHKIESQRTSSEIMTSPDSLSVLAQAARSKEKETLKADSSVVSDRLTLSRNLEQSETLPILQLLSQELTNGRVSKAKVTKFLGSLKVADKELSKSSNTEQTPPSAESKKD